MTRDDDQVLRAECARVVRGVDRHLLRLRAGAQRRPRSRTAASVAPRAKRTRRGAGEREARGNESAHGADADDRDFFMASLCPVRVMRIADA